MDFILYLLSGISLLLVALASACNSIMDTVDHHQSQSIFSKFKNGKWWNQHQGWKNKYVDYDKDIKEGIEPRRVKWKILGIRFNKPVQLTDSWHFFKMLMIIFICLAIIVFPYTIGWAYIVGVEWKGILYRVTVWVSVLGFAWNGTFRLTYDHLFLLKKYK